MALSYNELLQSFKAAIEHGSFKHAASQMFVSDKAMQNRMKVFQGMHKERIYKGIRGTGIVPTEYGLKLLEKHSTD